MVAAEWSAFTLDYRWLPGLDWIAGVETPWRRFCSFLRRGKAVTGEYTCSWITVFHKLSWSFLKLFHTFAMWFFFLFKSSDAKLRYILRQYCVRPVLSWNRSQFIFASNACRESCGLAYNFSFAEEWTGNTFMEFVVHKLIYNRLEPRSKKRVI